MTARHFVRAGFVVAALSVAGASNLHADQVTNEECTEAWESSPAYGTCKSGTSSAEAGNECWVDADCEYDGNPVYWSLVRPVDEISQLNNCEGEPTVGECSDDEEEQEEEQTLEEACREAWESSPSAEACVERAIIERPNDNCMVDLNCTQDDGRVMRAIATWTTDKLANLHYCQGPWLQPLPCNPTLEEQCIYNWYDSEASETCEATVTADGADWCEVDAMCQKEGYVVSDTISRPPAQIPQLKNCLGTLTVGQCPGE